MSELPTIERRASHIKLLLMDCDGVLTDGRLWLFEDGEQKGFHAHDGLGLELWHRAGLKSGIISGRNASVVGRRAAELKMEFVRQGVEDKTHAFDEILSLAGVEESEVAYVGDDLNDIPLLLRAELAVAVANASEETRAVAHFVTQTAGGSGALREVIEMILKAQGRWADVTERFLK